MTTRHATSIWTQARRLAGAGLAALGLSLLASMAHAEIDGYGPDAWRVHGVAAHDVLNARMGPGTEYRVIDSFAHDERGLTLVTCVPLVLMHHAMAMSEAEREALPPRWCLMRSADLSKAGWVRQRYLTEDVAGDAQGAEDGDMIGQAVDLVRALYAAAHQPGGAYPLDPDHAHRYFSSEVVAHLRAHRLEADPLTGAQDFDGSIGEPRLDPDQPMLRGMITVNVDFVNFGQRQTAVFRLRADPGQPGAPVRIFRIDHDGWSFP